MKTTDTLRFAFSVAGILAATVTLSGCMGPTYGTDKPAMAQLGDDLGSSVSIGSGRAAKNAGVAYNPRPGLVVASKQAQPGDVLPAPQESIAGRDNNPNWVEAPEETRERLRDEASRNANNPNYRSPLLAGKGQAGQLTETQKWEAFREAKKNAENVDISGQRRNLTDPPSDFRSADSANLQDLGEPEADKERRRKKEAEAASSGSDSSWWKPFQ